MRPSLRHRRILVVEDEAIIALQAEAMLRDFGCFVLGPAARVDEALDLADDAGIDAAVLDINLQGVSVGPVAAALAARAVPFLYVTATPIYALPEHLRARPHLSKPYQEAELRRGLEALLAGG